MNIEFHYYAVYALALEAGFDEPDAFTLAQSSQEIDASTTPLRFDAPGGSVELAVTQNYLFWDESVKRDIYLPFHFVPGDAEASARARADGKRTPYAVTPNSEGVKELLVSALKERDLYLIGVAAHAFADSWAHQNFSGLHDGANDLGRGSSASFAAGLPPAGHLQALTAPDEPDAVWDDPRLRPETRRVENRVRFAEAAKKLFRYFRVYLKKPFNDDELVVARLEAIWAKASKDERLADYVARLWRREAGAPEDPSALAGLRHYDKLAWARSQLSRAAGFGSEPTVNVGSSFYQTPLYRWHQAAVEHRRRAQSMLERKGL
jgi:hypothetical protein